MLYYAKFLKEVWTQKRFTDLPLNAYFKQVADSLHMLEGVVKYKNSGTPKVKETIMCVELSIGRALLGLGASVSILLCNLYTDIYLPPMKKISLHL